MKKIVFIVGMLCLLTQAPFVVIAEIYATPPSSPSGSGFYDTWRVREGERLDEERLANRQSEADRQSRAADDQRKSEDTQTTLEQQQRAK